MALDAKLTDPAACTARVDDAPLSEHDNGRELLDPTLAVRPVSGLAAAVEHINEFGSRHTEGVAAEDPAVTEEFGRRVDAAAILVNGSLSLNDGPKLGLGASLAITTRKKEGRPAMPTNDRAEPPAEVATAVKRMLITESRIKMDPAELSAEELLRGNTLNVSSLGFVGMLVRLEDELGTELQDNLFVDRKFTTVADIIDVVAEATDLDSAQAR